MFYNSQPKTRSPGGAAPCFIYPIEPLKDSRQLFPWNSRPGILYGKKDSLFIPAGGYLYLGSRVTILYGIFYQIYEGLNDQERIQSYGSFFYSIKPKKDPLLFRFCRREGTDLFEQIGKGNVLKANLCFCLF